MIEYDLTEMRRLRRHCLANKLYSTFKYYLKNVKHVPYAHVIEYCGFEYFKYLDEINPRAYRKNMHHVMRLAVCRGISAYVKYIISKYDVHKREDIINEVKKLYEQYTSYDTVIEIVELFENAGIPIRPERDISYTFTPPDQAVSMYQIYQTITTSQFVTGSTMDATTNNQWITVAG